MDDFTYSYPMKVYFGEDAAKKAFAAELGNYGKTVMLAYGGGSIKKSGIYEEMRTVCLKKQERRSLISPALCQIQHMRKYRKVSRLVRTGSRFHSGCWRRKRD